MKLVFNHLLQCLKEHYQEIERKKIEVAAFNELVRTKREIQKWASNNMGKKGNNIICKDPPNDKTENTRT
ncbi:unnamed protein product, partial [Dovyalis caffra]